MSPSHFPDLENNLFWEGWAPTSRTKIAIYGPNAKSLVKCINRYYCQLIQACKGWDAQIISYPPAAVKLISLFPAVIIQREVANDFIGPNFGYH